MRKVNQTSGFKRGAKRCEKRKLDMSKLMAVISMIAHNEKLPYKCHAHKLSGNHSGQWECHVAPDWLLIWECLGDDQLILIDTGTHADLFKN